MNQYIDNQDIYTVENSIMLSSSERRILDALYQPIIGFEAISLYYTLCSEVDNNNMSLRANRMVRLCKLMRLPVKQLVPYFNLLEGIGLIKVFYKANRDYDAYHFQLLSPSDADTFFKNPLLVSMLLEILGDDDFHRTKMQFSLSKFDITNYQNITKKYQDVFTGMTIAKIDDQSIYTHQEFASIDSDFNFKVLEEIIKEKDLSPFLLTKEVRDKIEMSFLAYDLTETEIMDLVIDSVKEDNFVKYVDLNDFDEMCRIKNQVKKYKTPFERIHLKDVSASNIYDKYSVVEFLNRNYSNLKINPEVLSELEKCMKNYNTNNGVMNIIIEYVVKRNNYIKMSYLKSIVADWNSKSIDSVKKALDLINKIETNYQNNVNKNNNNKQSYSKYTKVIGSESYWQDKIDQEPKKDVDDDYLEQIKMKFQTKGGE